MAQNQKSNSTPNDQCKIKFNHQGLYKEGTVNIAKDLSIKGANHQMSPTMLSSIRCKKPPRQNTNVNDAFLLVLLALNQIIERLNKPNHNIG